MRKRIFIFKSMLLLSLILSHNAFANTIAGNAIHFDGNQDYICIPDAPHLDGMESLTIELWFCPLDTSRYNPLVCKSDGIAVMTDRSYEIALIETTISTAYFSGTEGWTWLYSNSSNVISNNWIHIASTYDSVEGITKLYINGQLLSSTTSQAGGMLPISESIRSSMEDLILGGFLANPYHQAYFAYGLMDEVRIWNVARSDSQIGDYFNKIVDSTEYGLIGYWNFDEDINSQLVFDLSISGHNGMLGSSNAIELSDPTRIISTAPIIPEPITVPIDIKPHTCPNRLNPKSRGLLTVAVLGTEDFDVYEIDPASVELNGVSAIRSNYRDILTSAESCSCGGVVGPDGYPELIVKFEIERLVEILGEVNVGNEVDLVLTGVLYDENTIEGTDCIVITGKPDTTEE